MQNTILTYNHLGLNHLFLLLSWVLFLVWFPDLSLRLALCGWIIFGTLLTQPYANFCENRFEAHWHSARTTFFGRFGGSKWPVLGRLTEINVYRGLDGVRAFNLNRKRKIR